VNGFPKEIQKSFEAVEVFLTAGIEAAKAFQVKNQNDP
jgi:hypothetical protein